MTEGYQEVSEGQEPRVKPLSLGEGSSSSIQGPGETATTGEQESRIQAAEDGALIDIQEIGDSSHHHHFRALSVRGRRENLSLLGAAGLSRGFFRNLSALHWAARSKAVRGQPGK